MRQKRWIPRYAPLLIWAVFAAAALPVHSLPDFRVLPYQQSPTAGGITINWFTEDDIPGRLTVSGGDLNAPREFIT